MSKFVLPLAVVILLSACGGAAVVGPADGSGTDGSWNDGGDGSTDSTDGIDSDSSLPPGTASPTPSSRIVRYEPADDNGSGTATGYRYDSANDRFYVNNLAFDGANSAYRRGVKVGSLGRFAVYEGPDSFPDSATGASIPQFLHRAIYGVSDSGQVELAIVRTGSYVGYGFGGFVYQRNGRVTLPTTGQARFQGDYAALRDFEGRGGIEYAQGNMTMYVDFEDFDNGDGVRGYVTDRRVFDQNGNDITDSILQALSTQQGYDVATLPTLVFDVGPGSGTANGEMTGTLQSTLADPSSGAATQFEDGNYYAVLSGDEPDEVVGVIVVESADARGGFTTRETGGFILTRR